MRLGTRLVITVGMLIVALTGLVSIVVRTIFLDRATRMEEAIAIADLSRARRFLTWRAKTLSSTANDWAAWDDTYAFINDRNQDYIDANMVVGSLVDLTANVIVLFDLEGRPVRSIAADLGADTPRLVPVSEALWQRILSSERLRIRRSPEDALQGLLVASGELWLVASRPILNSQNEGPVRGSLLIARRWQDYEADVLALAAQNECEVTLPAAGTHVGQIVTRTDDSGTIYSQTVIPDVEGRAAATLRVGVPRYLYEQALTSVLYLNGWILLSGAVVACVAFWFVDRFVLRPLDHSLSTLRTELKMVVAEGNLTPRLPADSRDEMGELTAGINAMLEGLEQSRRRAAEHDQELERSRRLAALGTLVAGVAHEVNNPNSVIKLNASVLLRLFDRIFAADPPADQPAEAEAAAQREEARALVAEIGGASTRIATLVASLKGLTGPGEGHVRNRAVAVSAIVEDAEGLLRHELAARGLRIESHVDSELPPLSGDAQQLSQVLVNLLLNACEASRRGEGVIRIWAVPGGEAGTVSITVEDAGRGMDPETLEHMFDPFFTTRRDAGGMGLGLTICATIVSAHRGTIRAESSGRGTRVHLTLPAWQGVMDGGKEDEPCDR